LRLERRREGTEKKGKIGKRRDEEKEKERKEKRKRKAGKGRDPLLPGPTSQNLRSATTGFHQQLNLSVVGVL